MTSVGRSREETRARLLEAAATRFRESGFDATTVRDIAADAGVDPALINRYFGSKAGLFTEIALADNVLNDLLAGDRATLGQRLAELATKEHSPGVETVMRSLGNVTVSERYEQELHDQYVVPLARWLGGPDARLRAGLIVSMMNGIAMSQAVLQQRSLEAKPTNLTRHLGNALQTLIDS
jgi:AcrR family transcriptional regulator